MTTRDDAHLVEGAQAGDGTAFAEIVARYQTSILRHLFRLVHDRELALDLTQETFLKAYEALAAQRHVVSLAPWLFRIATNQALDRLRRRRRIRWLWLNAIGESGGGDPSVLIAEQVPVRRALAKLSPVERASLLLHAVEGFSHAEVGEILGISADAARKRYFRAKEAFLQAYESEVGR